MSRAVDTTSTRGPRETGALVVLRPVDAWSRDAVLALSPRRGQERYSGRPGETLPAAEADPARRPVVVVADGVPAGFFVLHRGPLPPLAPSPYDLLLRSFLVDAAHQGRGIGKAALRALPAFAAAVEPQAERVVLGVNVRNSVARHTYLRSGFCDTGELYLGGALGPQHVLELPLEASRRRAA